MSDSDSDTSGIIKLVSLESICGDSPVEKDNDEVNELPPIVGYFPLAPDMSESSKSKLLSKSKTALSGPVTIRRVISDSAKLSNGNGIRKRVMDKRDVEKRVLDKRDVEKRVLDKRDVEKRVLDKRDVEKRVLDKRVLDKRDVEKRVINKRNVDKRVMGKVEVTVPVVKSATSPVRGRGRKRTFPKDKKNNFSPIKSPRPRFPDRRVLYPENDPRNENSDAILRCCFCKGLRLYLSEEKLRNHVAEVHGLL